jgi:hypothetical protein
MADSFVNQATGQTVLFDDGRAVLRSRDTGKLYRVTPEQAQQDLLSGDFAPATRDEVEKRKNELTHGGVGSQAQTFGEAFAGQAIDVAMSLPRLLSFAGSKATGAQDPLEGFSGKNLLKQAGGEAYAKELEARESANPGTAMVGKGAAEIAGLVVGDKGLGTVVRGASRAARIGREAAVGSALGFSSTAAEAAETDTPLTVERALVGMGLGAVMNVAPGVALEGAQAAYRTAKRTVSPALTESAASVFGRLGVTGEAAANERAVKALGVRGSEIKKLGREASVQEMGRDLRHYELEDGRRLVDWIDSPESIAPKLAVARKEAGAKLGELRQKAADAGVPVLEDAKAYLARVDKDVLQELYASPSPTLRSRGELVASELAHLRNQVASAESAKAAAMDAAAKARESIIEPLSRSTNAAAKKTATEMAAAIESFEDLAASGGLSAARVQEFADTMSRATSAPSSTVRRSTQEILKELRAIEAPESPLLYTDLLKQQEAMKIVYPKKKGPGLPPPTPEWAENLKKAERLLEDSLEEHVERTLRRVSPDDVGRYADLKRLDKNLIRADEMNQGAVMGNIGNRFLSPTDYFTGGTAAVALGSAAYDGDLASSGLTGLAIAGAHRLVRTRGASFLARLATGAKKADSEMASAVQGMFAASSKGSVAARRVARATVAAAGFTAAGETMRDAAQRRSTEAAELAADPLRMADRLATTTGDLMQSSPQYAAAVQSTTARAISYLRDVAPRPQINDPLTPQLRRNTISEHAARKYAMQWEAATQPMRVIDRIARGDIRSEQVETLKAVYPAVHADLHAKVLEQLATRREPVPYRLSLRLNALLGLGGAGERFLQPDFQQRYAAALRGAAAQEEAKRAHPPSGGQPRMAATSQTTTQRLGASNG